MKIIISLLAATALLVRAELIETDLSGETVHVWNTTGDANQGVGVDEFYAYAVTNKRITKLNKTSGELIMQWDGTEVFSEGHFDSGVVVDGKLYAAQASWPVWPMASSVEVFDTHTMEHVDTFSFGIQVGSFTWLDRNDGYWWGGFASYDYYQPGAMASYGKGYNVQVVRMDDDFQIVERWQIPENVRATFETLSNSGGSWGTDGYLYLSGHDATQVYAMTLPRIGSVLHHAATVNVPDVAGQGIAWDRYAAEPTLYGTYRPNNQVIATRMPDKETIDAAANVLTTGVIHTSVSDFTS